MEQMEATTRQRELDLLQERDEARSQLKELRAELAKQDGELRIEVSRLDAATKERDEAKAQLKELRADMGKLQAAIRRTTEDVLNALAIVSKDLDFHKTELERANKVIALASAAINYMFDKRSDADIVTDDDMAATDEAFEAVQQWLEEHK